MVLVWNRLQESEDFVLRKGIIDHIWDIEQWYELRIVACIGQQTYSLTWSGIVWYGLTVHILPIPHLKIAPRFSAQCGAFVRASKTE